MKQARFLLPAQRWASKAIYGAEAGLTDLTASERRAIFKNHKLL